MINSTVYKSYKKYIEYHDEKCEFFSKVREDFQMMISNIGGNIVIKKQMY